MKKLFYAIATLAVVAGATACNVTSSSDTDLESYQTWRKTNDDWIKELQDRKNPDGTPFYKTVIPSWNPGAFILMHQFNDPAETAGNLVPLSTSTVDVIYIGHNCKGETFDSSYTVTAYGTPGVSRFVCNEVITGWTIALENMHVGDSVEVVIPYNLAYGTKQMSETILPYSALQFNMRLVDINKYEIR